MKFTRFNILLSGTFYSYFILAMSSRNDNVGLKSIKNYSSLIDAAGELC